MGLRQSLGACWVGKSNVTETTEDVEGEQGMTPKVQPCRPQLKGKLDSTLSGMGSTQKTEGQRRPKLGVRGHMAILCAWCSMFLQP